MLKPFSAIKSKNLGILLLIARISFVLGTFLFIAIVVNTLSQMLGTYIPYLMLLQFTLIPVSLVLILASGILAALVSFEENYRLRTEHLLKQISPNQP